MNRLIRIGILWCVAISIASAQEADTSKDGSNQRNPDEPQASASTVSADSKAVVLDIDARAQHSEVVKQVVEALEKAGVATTKDADVDLGENLSIGVTLQIGREESSEKTKRLIKALITAGVQRISIRAGISHGYFLILHAPTGYKPDELQEIKNAALTAAQELELPITLMTTGVHGRDAGVFFAGPKPDVAVEGTSWDRNGDGIFDQAEIDRFPSAVFKMFERRGVLLKAGMTIDEVRGVWDTVSQRPTRGSQPIGLRRAQAELKNAELKLAKLRLQLSDQHPSVKALELEIQAMEAQLQPREELLDTLQCVRSELVEKNEAARKENGSQNAETARLETLIAQLDDRIKSIEGTLAPDPGEVASVKVFALEHARATEAAEVLKQVHDRGPSKIVPDAQRNSVIVTGPEAQMQEIEGLLLKLDAVPSAANLRANLPAPVEQIEYKEIHPKFVPRNVEAREATSEDYKQQPAQLRTDYAAADKQAHDLADSLRQTPDVAKKAELRTAVQRAFTLRQSLLRAELQEMQARLEKTQQSLDMRDRIADQIVDRRVEDLLNPEFHWDPNAATDATVSTTSAANQSPKPETTSLPTELEGHWHWASGTDSLGKPIEVSPYNVSFKNDLCTIEFQGGQFDRRVQVDPDSKRIFGFMDNRAFLADSYRVEGDQLTLSGDGVTMVYQRGHAALSKPIPNATEEQKSRWRSGIVEILGGPLADKTGARPLIGYGVIISPQMRIVSQIRLPDGDSAFFAQFDDGGAVPIKIVEEGPQGWLVFEPEQPVEANHHFRLSEAAVGESDEVHFWGQAAIVSENPSLELFETTVLDLDRKAPALGQTVWQLFRHDKLDGSLPVLDSNGDLLAITIIGSRELLLAVPVSQLKTMFPKSFGQPSESEPRPVEALPDWLSELQGTWMVTDSPIKVDENSGGQMKEIRIDRDQWSIIWTAGPDDPDRVESLRVVRPDEKNLCAIDLVELSTGKVVYPSLYELDQAGLTFCYGYLGERPDEISTGSRAVTIKLARQQDPVTP